VSKLVGVRAWAPQDVLHMSGQETEGCRTTVHRCREIREHSVQSLEQSFNMQLELEVCTGTYRRLTKRKMLQSIAPFLIFLERLFLLRMVFPRFHVACVW